ncbi:separin-like isoform X2 [Branchiostoma floridae x Branchiostoma belcheri]
MADSDKIIRALKNGEEVGKLVTEIQTYLAPLLKPGASPSQLPAATVKNYCVFCMRLLRACLDCLGISKPGSPDIANTVRVAHMSYKCIQLCSPVQRVPLALEKLLFHIMSQLLSKNLLSDALTIASFLHQELKSFQTSMTSEKEGEFTNIAKHSFDALLKGALRICDVKTVSSNSVARRELGLTAGQQALQILALSNVDPQWYLGKVISIAKHFEDMFQGSVPGHDSISKFCQALYRDMLESAETKEDRTQAQVCLQQLGFQVCRYLQLARKDNKAMNFIDQMMHDVQRIASKKQKSQDDLLSASARVFKASLLCNEAVLGNTAAKPDWGNISTILEESSEVVRDRMDAVNHAAGMALLEAYNQLRKGLENILDAGGQGQGMLSMSRSEFCSVETALTLFMDVLQAQRGQDKEQKTSPGRLDSQQCVKLQMAAVYLLLQLTKHYISVRADSEVLPRSLVVVQRAMGIIEDVSSGNGGGMSTSELKYLGSHIYNLSICVYSHGWYREALPLIQTAAQLLQRWCQASGQQDSANQKLAERFWLLSECQLKLDLCEVAMTSAASALLADPGHMIMPVESWVRAKRQAVEKDGDLRTRTLRDAIRSLDSSALNQEQMIKVLQEELRVLQSHRYDSSYEQYCVICDLLDVQGDSKLQERAHTMVQLGQLLLSCPGTITSNCSAVECCEEAVFLLEEMIANQGSDCAVSMTTLHDDLATAYMWLYMCKRQEELALVPKLESSLNQNDKEKDKDSQLTYTENEASLSKLLANINLQGCELGPEEVAMASLDCALENWCVVLKEGLDLSAVRSVESTAKCLKITSSMYGLAGRPYHQAQAHCLLITLMEAVQNYEEAVFTVAMATISACLHGNSRHADHLLTKAESMLGKLEMDSRASVMLKVAKSHFLLLTGEVGAGWKLVCEVLASPILEECSTMCYMLSAQARHVQSLYLRLPPRQANMDRADGSCFESAFDAFRVRLSLARLLFGERLRATEQLVSATSGPKATTKTKKGYPHLPWWCCDDFLISLLDVGRLYSEQGCVKEAKSYFLEGLEIAANFRLPRRCAEFLTKLAEVELHRGLTEDCQLLLKGACSVLQTSTDDNPDLRKPLLSKDYSLSRISVSKDSVSFDEQSPDPRKDTRTTVEKEKPGSRTTTSKKEARKDRKSGGCFGFDSLESEEEEEDEDDFIRSKPLTVSVSQQLEHDGIDSDLEDYGKQQHQPSFPTMQLPDYVGHSAKCACSACKDVASQASYLDIFLTATECAVSEGLPAIAIATASASLKVHGKACTSASAVMKDFCKSLFNGGNKETKTKKNSNTECFAPQLALLHCRLAEAYLMQENFPKANSSIKAGLNLFHGKVRAIHLHSNTHAHLLYSAALCAILQEAAKCNCSPFDVLNCNTSNQADVVGNLEKCMAKLSLKPGQGKDFSAAKQEAKDSDAYRSLQALEEDTMATLGKQKKRQSRKPVIKVDSPEVTEVIDPEVISVEDSDDVFVVSKPKTSRKYVAKASTKKDVRKKKAKDDNSDPEIIPDSDPDEYSVKKSSTASRKFFTSKTPAKMSLNRKEGACEVPDSKKDEDCISGPVQTPLVAMRDKVVDDYTFVGSPETSKTRRGRGRGTATSKANTTARKPARGKKVQAEATETDTKRKPRCAKAAEKATAKDLVSTQARRGKTSDSDSDLPIALAPSTQKRRPQRKAASVVYKEESSSEDSSTVQSKPKRTTRQAKTAPPTRARARRVTKKVQIDDYSSADEILRGASSEEEDCAPVIKRRGRAAKSKTSTAARGKKAPTRPKPSTEDVEVLRECVQIGEEDSTLGSTLLTSSSVQEAVPVLGGRITPCGSSIADATLHLETAHLLIQHTQPSLLSRMILQLLFLCCPEDSARQAAYYMMETCSVTLRHQMIASLHKKIKKLQKAEMQALTESMDQLSLTQAPSTQRNIQHLRTKQDIFALHASHSEHSYTAHNMQDVLAKQLPEGWTVCSMALVSINPSCHGNKLHQQLLVITRLQAKSEPLIVKIPISQVTLEREILIKLETIQHDNKTSVAIHDKKQYWKARQELDSLLKDLTKAMENDVLGGWKGVVLGCHGDKKREKQLNSAAANVCKALGSDNRVDFQLLRLLLDSWAYLRKRRRQDALAFLLGTSAGSPLLQNGLDLMQREVNKVNDLNDLQDRGPVILVLDRTLQRLPWESIPLLQQGKVSRMPSLRFILSHLHTMRSVPGHVLCDGVDQNNTYYVLNPRNDLASTQAYFQDDFKKRGWSGVAGVSPTTEQYISALTDHDMFVYCGHGAGQVYLKGDEIQKITTRATTLLMGCGSGRLFVEGSTEARGMALNYILSGCPSIVANLWDVTDRDIDRFLQALLKSWLTSDSNSSLLEFVSQSREACKLRHLIGAAPVVYGFPVRVK